MINHTLRRIPRDKRLRSFRKAVDVQREIELERYRREKSESRLTRKSNA